MTLTDQDLLALAKHAGCTHAQIEALTLKAHGYGKRRSATILGISTSAVGARLDGAYRKIRRMRNAA